jgi:hypothetical protein
MPKFSLIAAIAITWVLIAHGESVAQTAPLAGSAGAGSAAVSGVPNGPGSAGGVNNSVNDPSGVGNAGKITTPPPGAAVAPVPPTAPQRAGAIVPRSGLVPSRRSRGGRFARNASPREAEIRMKENDRLLNRSLKSICRGC